MAADADGLYWVLGVFAFVLVAGALRCFSRRPPRGYDPVGVEQASVKRSARRERGLEVRIAELEKELEDRRRSLRAQKSVTGVLTARLDTARAEEAENEALESFMDAKGRHVYGDAWDGMKDGDVPLRTIFNLSEEEVAHMRKAAMKARNRVAVKDEDGFEVPVGRSSGRGSSGGGRRVRFAPVAEEGPEDEKEEEERLRPGRGPVVRFADELPTPASATPQPLPPPRAGPAGQPPLVPALALTKVPGAVAADPPPSAAPRRFRFRPPARHTDTAGLFGGGDLRRPSSRRTAADSDSDAELHAWAAPPIRNSKPPPPGPPPGMSRGMRAVAAARRGV